MRAVLQRVTRASVTVDGEIVGELTQPGLVVLVGIRHDDGPEQVAWMARKIRELRMLHDERSVADEDAAVLVVSQFTLYGDARKGRRPTWSAAAPAEVSEPLYQALCDELEDLGTRVERGVFGAQMEVSLVNDGPFTLTLDSP
jgi:D-tyrosyl-tRNA(Tyr) deacylase